MPKKKAKFSNLPGILTLPNLSIDSEIDPYKVPTSVAPFDDSSSQTVFNIIDSNDNKFDEFESRMDVIEKSNQTLLNEVIRLQKRSDEVHGFLKEERLARKQLENSLRASGDVISHLSNKLEKYNSQREDDTSSISNLINRLKAVEESLQKIQKDGQQKTEENSTKYFLLSFSNFAPLTLCLSSKFVFRNLVTDK